MPQNACVVIQQLNKDIPPETAQPLAILEHGSGAVGSLIRRLERPHLHVCNGSDQAYRNTSGKAGLRLVTARCLRRLAQLPVKERSWRRSAVRSRRSALAASQPDASRRSPDLAVTRENGSSEPGLQSGGIHGGTETGIDLHSPGEGGPCLVSVADADELSHSRLQRLRPR